VGSGSSWECAHRSGNRCSLLDLRKRHSRPNSAPMGGPLKSASRSLGRCYRHYHSLWGLLADGNRHQFYSRRRNWSGDCASSILGSCWSALSSDWVFPRGRRMEALRQSTSTPKIGRANCVCWSSGFDFHFLAPVPGRNFECSQTWGQKTVASRLLRPRPSQRRLPAPSSVATASAIRSATIVISRAPDSAEAPSTGANTPVSFAQERSGG